MTTDGRGESSEHSLMSPEVPDIDTEYPKELARNNILKGNLSRDPPRNLREVRAALNRPRNDTSVTEEDQNDHDMMVDKAGVSNEAYLKSAVLPDILDLSDLYRNLYTEMLPEMRWVHQRMISEKLGQPRPNFTLDLPCEPKYAQYLQTFDPAQTYSGQLQPVEDIVCPLLTLEAKGSFTNAELLNRHNGACMLLNCLNLRRAANSQDRSFHNKIQALTIEVTPWGLQVSCHWMDGDGRCLSARIEHSIDILDLERTRQLARNAIDWTKQELGKLDSVLFDRLERKATGKRKRSESPLAGSRKK